jgi:hypothetical protein
LSGSPTVITTPFLPTNDPGPLDSTAPETITDLAVVPSSTASTSLTISWTATGDDGAAGTATEYEVRYATFPLTAQNFSQGRFAPAPQPALAGRTEQITLVGLASNTQYFVAIIVRDEAGNASFATLPDDQVAQTGLRRGYTLVSIPKVLSSQDNPVCTVDNTVCAVFGDDVGDPATVYRWRSMGTDVDTGCYDGSLGPFTNNSAYICSQITTVGTALGYYLYNPSESSNGRAVLDAPETSTSVTAPTVDIALSLGFNMVGNPYEREIPLSAVSVRQESTGTTVSYQTAVDRGWVGPSLLVFDGVVSRPYAASDLATVLKPWNGGWIQSFQPDMVLVFTRP